MIREVDLGSYLPDFMQAYTEPTAALAAENPEFDMMWKAVDKVLHNRFITTADEYGISRYEKMLGIYPESTDDLETRRIRVANRWFNAIPYTVRTLAKKIGELLGGEYHFSIQSNFAENYEISVTVFSLQTQMNEELKYLLSVVIPENMVIRIIYENVLAGSIYSGGMMFEADIIQIREG